jgi:hypothetical protein
MALPVKQWIVGFDSQTGSQNIKGYYVAVKKIKEGI